METDCISFPSCSPEDTYPAPPFGKDAEHVIWSKMSPDVTKSENAMAPDHADDTVVSTYGRDSVTSKLGGSMAIERSRVYSLTTSSGKLHG